MYENIQDISVIFNDKNMALPNVKDRLINFLIIDNILINIYITVMIILMAKHIFLKVIFQLGVRISITLNGCHFYC